MSTKIISPLIYNQEKYYDYGVDREGNIYSRKRGDWKKMKLQYKKNDYVYCGIVRNAEKRQKCILVHVAVHETLNPKLPKHPKVPNKDWMMTPLSVKKAFRGLFEVHHVNHNRHDHRSSNLQWTTKEQNIQEYQKYRRAA